jgi:hypothetical protein
MTPSEYRKFKNIPDKSKVNLRDNMTDLELIFTMLGEKVTTEISKKEKPETFEIEYDAYAKKLAMDWIISNPTDWLINLPKKFIRFWFIDWPDPRTHNPFYWVPWMLSLGFGILGLWNKKCNQALSILILLMVVYSVVVLIFFPQSRYLVLIKFFFLAFSAIGIHRILQFPKTLES